MNTYLSEVGPVAFPAPTGICINMLPFRMGDPGSIPEGFQGYVPLINACNLEWEQMGKVGFLSVQESMVTAEQPTQRRAGIHTDKHPRTGWGGGWGSGEMSDKRRAGIYLASTVSNSCRAWNLPVPNPGPMGDCDHLRGLLPEPVYMLGNELYWITDATPHESLPMPPGTLRQWFRLVTHEVDVWYEKHSTANPSVTAPCRIITTDKFLDPHKPKSAPLQDASERDG